MRHEWHIGTAVDYDESGRPKFRNVEQHSVMQRVNGRLAHVPFYVEIGESGNRRLLAALIVQSRRALREFLSAEGSSEK